MKNLSKVFYYLGFSLILLAIVIFITNKVNDNNLKSTSKELINSVSSTKEVEEKSNDLKKENIEKPTEEKIINELIGILKIPKLELELPVFSEFSYKNIKKSVARYRGTVIGEPENLVIVGHNFKNHFGRINELSYNDYIIFENFYGESYKYFLTESKIIEETDFDSINLNDYKIAILTCNFNGSKRILTKFK